MNRDQDSHLGGDPTAQKLECEVKEKIHLVLTQHI